MIYDVFIYKGAGTSVADIQTPVEASDPIAAALSVLDRFGLRSAFAIFVSCDSAIVARLFDVDLDSVPVAAADCSVSYDYGW